MTNDATADGLPSGGQTGQARAHDVAGGLGEQAQKRIGTHLRSMYDSIVQQPIPDRFKDLIARLDEAPDATSAGCEKNEEA